ncbi:MAG TPA: hypothetical protein VGE35_03245 [Candidatus Paceibacterota bacterium]
MSTQSLRPAFRPAAQAQASSINLNDKDMTKMLLKFNFRSQSHIPKGIPQQPRRADFTVDQAHAAKAANSNLGEVGRVREGRVDTGRPVIQNLPFVQVRVLRASLRNAGCGIIAAHWYHNPSKDTYVVVVEVALGSNPDRYNDTPLSAEAIEGLRNLSRCIWQYCHVWENKPKDTGTNGIFTVNLVGLQPSNARSQNMLAVRDGHMLAIPFVESED